MRTNATLDMLRRCLAQGGFGLITVSMDSLIPELPPIVTAKIRIDDDLLTFDEIEAQKRVKAAEKIFKTMNEIGKPAEQNETRPLTELTPKRILKSGNRTIVFWEDGTKTMVKRADDEAESDYAAFTAALAIKLYGSNSAVKRIVDKTETQKPKKQKAQKEN